MRVLMLVSLVWLLAFVPIASSCSGDDPQEEQVNHRNYYAIDDEESSDLSSGSNSDSGNGSDTASDTGNGTDSDPDSGNGSDTASDTGNGTDNDSDSEVGTGSDSDKPGSGEEECTLTDESGGNGTSTQDEETAETPIVGRWLSKNRKECMNFGADGSYIAYLRDNSSTEWELEAEGTYTYSELKRWLWVSVSKSGKVTMEEYRCVIDDTSMTLTTTEGLSVSYSRQ